MLASINKIETAFGTNLNVSSAGAVGWMQFLPSTWQAYGVDANDDGRKDPYNPVDAICAAARYLKAAGGDQDLRQAIFAYNHADWYVDEVLLYANQYGKLPDDLVGSLTGLTEGAHFPVAADARYADDISEREALARSQTNRTTPGNAADVISSVPDRRGINIYSSVNAPVVAVNDGVIQQIGENAKLGKYIVLQDAYGNRYTYAQLGSIVDDPPGPQGARADRQGLQARGPERQGRGPERPGDRRRQRPSGRDVRPPPARSSQGRLRRARSTPRSSAPASSPCPQRAGNADQAGVSGQLDNLLGQRVPGYETFKNYVSDTLQVRREDDGAAAAQGRLQGHRRHRARPHRPDAGQAPRTSTSRSSPPAAARRRSTRSRSSTAGSCSRRPRSTAPPARTRSTPTRPSARSC